LQLSDEGAVTLLGGGKTGQHGETLPRVVRAEEGGREVVLVVGRGTLRRLHLHPAPHRLLAPRDGERRPAGALVELAERAIITDPSKRE